MLSQREDKPLERTTPKGTAAVLSCLLLAFASPAVSQEDKTAQAAAPLLSQEEREWLESRPVIRFGADPSWPPFSMREGDSLEGLDRDYLDLLEGRLGVRFEYVPTQDWEETLAKLRRGEIDFVTGIANLRERPLGLLYTKPYADFPVATIMRGEGPFFTSLERIEREGLLLAAPSGYAPTVHLETKHRGIRLLRTGTSLEALKAVSEGRADASLENLGVASHLIRVHGLGNLKIAGVTSLRFDTAFGIREELPLLRSLLDKALADLSTAEKLEVAERWILLDVSRVRTWKRLAMASVLILVMAGAVVALVGSWNRRLSRELNHRRTAEESLRQSEERFRHLFETMEDAYFLTQPDGKIQFVNGSAVEMLKIGSRPVVERLNFGDFLKYPGELAHLLERLHREGRLRDEIVEFVRADGLTSRCRCQIRTLGDSSGDEVGIEWLARPERPAATRPVPAS